MEHVDEAAQSTDDEEVALAGSATTAAAGPEAPEDTAAGAPETEADSTTYPTFCVVQLVAVQVELPDQFAVVVLHEDAPPYRSLRFPVGMADGAAMAAILEDRPSPRPLTHDLFAAALQRLNVDVVAARLTGRAGGQVLAEVDLMGTQGRQTLPCRPSDAINLALRQPGRAPLLCDDGLFD